MTFIGFPTDKTAIDGHPRCFDNSFIAAPRLNKIDIAIIEDLHTFTPRLSNRSGASGNP